MARARPAGAARRAAVAGTCATAAALTIGALVVATGVAWHPRHPAPTPPIASALPTPPMEDDTVHVALRARPLQATFLLDGTVVLPNPYIATVPRSAVVHTLVVRAPGYVDRRFDDVSFATSLALEISLEGPKVVPVGTKDERLAGEAR